MESLNREEYKGMLRIPSSPLGVCVKILLLRSDTHSEQWNSFHHHFSLVCLDRTPTVAKKKRKHRPDSFSELQVQV